jgi:hypothetical protein
MVDSILAHYVEEVEIAEDFYKRMWRSQSWVKTLQKFAM